MFLITAAGPPAAIRRQDEADAGEHAGRERDREDVVAGSPRQVLEHLAVGRLGQLVGTLTLVVGDRMTADELAQETFVRVRQRWDHVRVMDSP